MLQIPISADSHQSFQAQINAKNYHFELRWVSIIESWILTILNSDQDKRIVDNKILQVLAPFNLDDRLIEGNFLILPTKQGLSLILTEEAFLSDYAFFWVSKEEQEELNIATIQS